MKEKSNKLIKKLKIVLTAFIILTTILFITTISLYNSLKKEKQFEYTYKLNCIDTVKTNISRDEIGQFLDITSYEISLENESHNFITYVIAKENNTKEYYSDTYNLTYKNTYNHLIDYNTGKVEIRISLTFQNLMYKKYQYSKSFTCFTKGEDHTIKFYTDEKLKTEYIFKLPDPTADKILGDFNVQIEIQTAYKT